jgi:hypothetical protein
MGFYDVSVKQSVPTEANRSLTAYIDAAELSQTHVEAVSATFLLFSFAV